jgi:hypothetical protein|uniref:Dehydrogenase accessory protein n=1 Tax=Siphoviridae sp. ct5jB2 TaxID=2825337 RepID=A0A8S5TTJ9_9CAUD|nr:MAG TPA: dehydrogenase accessory protein [Siphoviridae sp. ct5jB2]
MECFEVFFCPKCKEETGDGFFREYSEEYCKECGEEVPPRICPKHHCEGEPVDIPDSEYLILWDQTEDPDFIEAMVKLRKDDIIEYRTKFLPFKQAEEAVIAELQSGLPHCPHCNSTDLSKISNLSKAGKIGLFGIFGAGDLGKTYKCNKCGCKF